eukprot:7878455-Karenia_brevis.AAC.1
MPTGQTLSNLRFADDILLLATSRADVAKMILHLRDEASKFGLRLHLGKTKILTNSSRERDRRNVDIDGDVVSVLDVDAWEKYLGRRVTMHEAQQVELDFRTAGAWAAFAQYKSELCNRNCFVTITVWMCIMDADT